MNRFRKCCIGCLGLGLGWAAALPAFAEGGLTAPDSQLWSGWQGRLSLLSAAAAPLWRSDLSRAAEPGLKVQGFGLLGDYYFMQAPLTGVGGGGFRATTGVLVGGASSLWGGASVGNGGLSFAHRSSLGATSPGGSAEALGESVAPYVGLGYSGLSSRGGWGFAADLGLMALSGGDRVRLGAPRAPSGQDERLRDLRLTPVLQLGVTYAF